MCTYATSTNTKVSMEKRKLKVAIDTTYMDRRNAKGTAIFIRECVAQLVHYKNELDITLIHRESIPEEPLYSQFKEIIIPHIKLKRGSRLISELIFFLTTKERFDVYYFAYSKLPPHFLFAPAKKIVSMQYDGGPDTAGVDLGTTVGKIRPWMLPLMRRFVDIFIATSEFGKRGLVERRGLPEKKVQVAYGGADTSFHPINQIVARAYLEKEYSLGSQPFIVASGRLDPHKNILRLIEAYDILRTKYNVRHPLIVTGGVHMSGYSELVLAKIAELKLEPYVTILLVREFKEMPYFYSGADIMVFPSLYEGFGLPLAEAMRCGVATVASRGSSLTEVGGDATEFFDPTNPEDMARGMYAVLSNEDYRKALCERGLIQAEKFTWEKHTASMVEIFKQLSESKTTH